MGSDRANHPERDDGVDLEHRLELLVAHLVDDSVPGVAGVVDDRVDRAERLDRGLDELVAGSLGGQVAAEDGGLAVDLARGLLGDVAVDVVDQDLGALGDEQLSRRPADPARRARDDRRLAVEKSHVEFQSPVFGVKVRGTLFGCPASAGRTITTTASSSLSRPRPVTSNPWRS